MPERALNATAASLLGFLHRGPMTGWDLVAAAQARIGDFWTVTRSQVYRELAAMAAAGLVEAGPRGRRDRRPYALTDRGRAAFRAWVLREPGIETIRFPLLLTLAFGEHVPRERLAAFMEHHRELHAARLARYRAIADAMCKAADSAAEATAVAEVSPYSRATLEFGLLYEEAVLTWFDRLPAELRRVDEAAGRAGGWNGRRRTRRWMERPTSDAPVDGTAEVGRAVDGTADVGRAGGWNGRRLRGLKFLSYAARRDVIHATAIRVRPSAVETERSRRRTSVRRALQADPAGPEVASPGTSPG